MSLSRKTDLPPSLSSQVSTGKVAADEVKQVADYLAELLRDIHGGTFRVDVDHQARYVMIAVG